MQIAKCLGRISITDSLRGRTSSSSGNVFSVSICLNLCQDKFRRALLHILLWTPLKAGCGRRQLESIKIQLWTPSLILYLQTANNRDGPGPQQVSTLLSREKEEKQMWKGGTDNILFLHSENPCPFGWFSESLPGKARPETMDPATFSRSLHTCVMLGCLRTLFKFSAFSPRATLWGCLQTESGVTALAALQKFWGSWKEV